MSSSKGASSDSLSKGMEDMRLDAVEDAGWEVCARKSKNRAGSSIAKPWPSQSSNNMAWGVCPDVDRLGMKSNNGSGKSPSNPWPTLTADSKQPAGRGKSKSQSPRIGSESSYVAPPPAIPPLGKWSSRPVITESSEHVPEKEVSRDPYPSDCKNMKDDDEYSDDSGAVDDSDYELLSDDFDSDESQKSHETRKKNRWFKKFFKILDSLTIEQINEPERRWHCPACQNGPGSIHWFPGLQPLLTHARTNSKRAKLHRELAELLDEELQRRGTSVIPAGEVYGKWEGLKEANSDKEIVWPPMVIIMNTRLDKDENEMWIGMGNQELLDYFGSYAATRARHAYGPQGHRGLSVLIFETSAIGYLEAERLSSHFKDNGTDREAWEHNRVVFYPGGKRQLYGYMAEKRDLDYFNQHAHGKSKLKFEMRSYEEMVVSDMRQMSEDNQQLLWFKNRANKEKMVSKALEESLDVVTKKLSQTMVENQTVRQRTKMHHEEIKEEMEFLEQFFKDQINVIRESRDAVEENFEKLQQEERGKIEHSSENPLGRADKISKFIKFQDKKMQEFEAEREKLGEVQKKKIIETKRRQGEELIELEKEYDAELNRLMEKYAPKCSEEGSSSSNPQ